MAFNDVSLIFSLLRGQPRKGGLAERLQAFYAPQAQQYDAFRERLLHGRDLLVRLLNPPVGSRIVELGGGTGRNMLAFGDRLPLMESVEIVDLCPALLDQARQRTRGMSNVSVVEADAVTYKPARPVDCVYFSYSLTMIPDWRGAVDNALSMLKPGGALGSVDFYISSSRPRSGEARHGRFARAFWPRWFAHDGVFLRPEQSRYLRDTVPSHLFLEDRGSVPYLPGLRAPYYVFIGRLPAAGSGGLAG